MEEEPAVAEPATRRSKRARVTVRDDDFTRLDGLEVELDEEREESSDDFEEPRRKAKKNRATEGASTSGAVGRRSSLSLIDVIKGDAKMIPNVVKFWVEKYERSRNSAMAELLTLLFQACGADYFLQENDVDKTDVDDAVVQLVNIAKAGDIEDFQNSKRDLKHFKENLLSFIDNVVGECQDGPLFEKDEPLFDRCIDYIIALSCTPPRFYRQIATLMGLQFVSSFINVANKLGSLRETTQRQLNAEKKKNAEGPGIESLNKRLSMAHEKITIMEDMMRKIFTGLFVHRYRDIDPDIRMSCIDSLGKWILEYPSLFLRDLYLKYLGWTLNDKNPGVRKTSILALQSLYEVDDNVPSLNHFTERFSKRMVELADDIDISVAVCAIGLVKQLLRHRLVLDEDLGSLYDLLIDDPPDVRRAIGGLVYDHLIAQKFNDSRTRPTGTDSEPSEVYINRMLKILREFSADPILSSYVIDDIWDYMKAMKDWKCIIQMILEDNPSAELDDMDATNLIRLFIASARKAVGERIVPATDNRHPHQTKAQKEMFENSKREITAAMMKNYPLLLRKFISDKDKVGHLIEIMVHMNLELYSLKRQEQNFKTTLKLIRDVFFKHGEKDALRSCVKAIRFCATNSLGELQDFASNQVKELQDELIRKLRSAIKDVQNGGDEYSLLVNLKRLYELQLSCSVPVENMYHDFADILKNHSSIDDEVAAFLLLNMFLHVSWSLHSVLSSNTVSEASLSSLVEKRDSLLQQLQYFLDDPRLHVDSGSNALLAYRVCGILADTWCLFRRSKFASTKLDALGYSPDKSVIKKYWNVCQPLTAVSDDEEDEKGNREYVEDTNADTIMFCLAKLVATDSVPKEHLAPEIVAGFVKYGPSVGEIVKNMLTALKKKGDISAILLESLKQVHQNHLLVTSHGKGESLSKKSIKECKDLAIRLSGMYAGAARNKYRSEILNIVKGGINYAFVDAPKRLSFLDAVLQHFATKLPASDMSDIMNGVKGRIVNLNTDKDPGAWRPYHTFLETLREKEGAKDAKEVAAVRRRGRPRKVQNVQGKRLFDEQNSSGEEDSISGSEQDHLKHEDEDDDNPSIQSLRASSKSKSSRSSKDDKRI